MLDSAAPAEGAASSQTSVARPELSGSVDKSKPAKPADNGTAQPKPAGDMTTDKDKAVGHLRAAKPASVSKDGTLVDPSTDANVTANTAANTDANADATTVSADSDGNAVANVVQTATPGIPASATPDQPVVAATPAVVIAPTLALPVSPTPDTSHVGAGVAKAIRVSPEVAQPVQSGSATVDAYSEAQQGPGVISERAVANKSLNGTSQTGAKLIEGQGQAPDGAPIDSQNVSPEGISPAPPQAGLESSDGKPRSDVKTVADFQRVFAEVTAGHAAPDAPALEHGDISAAATSSNAATAPGAPIQSGAGAPATTVNAATIPGQSAVVAVPLAGLAVEIATQAHAGKNHFDIRLDPPELGRINVKLDVDRDGNVSTRLIVDRSDTLDLLKRDASTLERALQQAGLKTSDHGLDFSLRQHAFTEPDTSTQSGTRMVVPDDDSAPLDALRQGYGRLLGMGGGLDIRV
jgi:flagellar hook-length control protein FliK